MINLYIYDTKDNKKFTDYRSYLDFISHERKMRIEKFHQQNDKILSLFVELLIRIEVIKSLQIKNEDIHFLYSEYGKPYLKDFDDFYFSISHTDSTVCVISSFFNIGVDIEKIKKCDLKIAKRFFCEDEYEYIITNSEPDKAFYCIWTQKEAYVKLLGTGLSTPLNSFSVLNPELRCYFKTFDYNDYIISVALEKDEEVTIKELSVNELLQSFQD